MFWNIFYFVFINHRGQESRKKTPKTEDLAFKTAIKIGVTMDKLERQCAGVCGICCYSLCRIQWQALSSQFFNWLTSLKEKSKPYTSLDGRLDFQITVSTKWVHWGHAVLKLLEWEMYTSKNPLQWLLSLLCLKHLTWLFFQVIGLFNNKNQWNFAECRLCGSSGEE